MTFANRLRDQNRRLDPNVIDYGGCMLVDANSNFAIVGSTAFAYSATLHDIEEFLTSDAF